MNWPKRAGAGGQLKETIILRVALDAVKIREILAGRAWLIIGTPSTGRAESIELTPTRARRVAAALIRWADAKERAK